MKNLDLNETAEFLNDAIIEQTVDAGHAIVHTGVTEAGHRFVLLNDATGMSVLSLSL